MKKKHKILHVKNKKIRIIGAIICVIVLVCFVAGIVTGVIGGHNYDIKLMKLGIRTSVIAAIFMGILHIIYFRTPKRLKKLLYSK